ncbi:MAG: hypothetical protein J0I21_06410 [Alphaproteobacteria bacterium]|nr:hypothetical protein [Alphaproteobacteria bacterium]
MHPQLAGHRALITGGGNGLRLAAAEVLAWEGCNVTPLAPIRPSSTPPRLEAVRPTAEAAGEIDILVNNAGAIPPGDLLAVDEATWRRVGPFGFIGFCRAARGSLSTSSVRPASSFRPATPPARR